MANEAVLVQDLETKHLEVTVADNTGLAKGTILKLTDPNEGEASSADGDFFLGILLEEKVADDGQTRMAVSRHGVWDLKLTDATVAAGEMVKISGANLVALADDDTIANSGEVVGMALQDGTNNEVIEVLVGAQ
jgi:hypothetical protein